MTHLVEVTDQQRDNKYQHVFEAYPVAFHLCVKRVKILVAYGELNLWRKTDGSICGNINHFIRKYPMYKDSPIYKLEYDTTVSYMVEGVSGGFVVQTFEVGDLKIPDFEEIMRSFTTIESLESGLKNAFFQQKIKTHCPNILEGPVLTPGLYSRFLKASGRFSNYIFGSVEDLSGPSLVGDTFSDKTKNFVGNSWQTLKNKFKRSKKAQILSEPQPQEMDSK